MAGNVIEELIGSIKQESGTSTKSISAVVSKTDDDGVVWVRLAGSDQDTPTASVSAEVKPGDAVTVEWRNKKLYVAGNYSNPAAGVERVQIAEEGISTATKVINTVKKAVTTVAKIAGNTAQYFWHTETGTDTGVHITEIPKDDFLADPANGGGNLLARSNGIAVRDGLTELSRFGADGIQIGQDGQTRSVIGARSMQLVDGGDNVYFGVGDKRVDGLYTFTAEHPYIVTRIREHQLVVSYPINTNYSVTVLDENDNVISYDRISGSFVIVADSYTFSENGLYKVLYTTSNPVYSFCYLRNSNFVGCNAVSFAFDGKAYGDCSFTEGDNTTASALASHAEGNHSTVTAKGREGHAEGYYTTVADAHGHAEGSNTAAHYCAHSEGYRTTASGNYSHSEGYRTTASDYCAHSEGDGTAANYCCHSEGDGTVASGHGCHSEGYHTVASGDYCHSEGFYTTASGNYGSHAEGYSTVASGKGSHASGHATYSTRDYQTAIGKYNSVTTSTDSEGNTVYDAGNYAFVIGNGDSSTRSNALTVDWDGNIKIYNPNLTVGTTPSANNNNMALYLGDKNGNRMGCVGYNYNTDGDIGIILQGYRNVNSKNYFNTLNLSVDTSGGYKVTVSAPAAWRSALGLGNVLDLFRVTSFKKTNVSINANGTATAAIPITIPSGFTAVCIVNTRCDATDTTSSVNMANCFVYNSWISGTTANVSIKNVGSSAAKVTAWAYILFDRNTL